MRHSEALHVLRDHARFSSGVSSRSQLSDVGAQSRTYPLPLLIDLDPPEHTRIRRVATLALSRGLGAHGKEINRLGSDLCEGIRPRGTADLVAELARPFAEQALALVVGIPPDMLSHVLALAATSLPEDLSPAEALEYSPGLPRFMSGLLSGEPGPAGCATVVRELASELAGPGTVTLGEAVGILVDLVFAGREPVTRAFSNALLLAHTHGLQRRGAPLVGVVEEALRLRPPTRVVYRRDMACRGTGDQRLVVDLESANHDGTEFTAPLTYDPFRANVRRHLAFGAGLHRCPGASLARLELAVLLSHILSWPDLQPTAEPRPDGHPLANGWVSLPMRWRVAF